MEVEMLDNPATWRSVKLGVDCIEHSYGLKDETIQLIAERGTFYVPTIICNLSDQYINEREERLARLGYSEDNKLPGVERLSPLQTKDPRNMPIIRDRHYSRRSKSG
jgi:hypothetical protein